QKYWLGLSLVKQLGSVRIQNLISQFGTAENVWKASKRDLEQVNLPKRALASLLECQKTMDLDAELSRLNKIGAHLVTLADSAYPTNLRTIVDPPVVLYVRGTLIPNDALSLGIVGTRRATRYGKDASEKLSHWLASQQVTIVSGMALGIDQYAHMGAIKARGRTIAVLGSGIDILYPRENTALAHDIMENGAVISEFPLGTPPTGRNFPRRNRLLSGLSLGVLVVEAPLNSGALITAESALEQGRDVFAVPSGIFNKMGQGTNKIIQEGAKLVMDGRDVLDELNISYTNHVVKQKTTVIAPSNSTEETVLTTLDTDPIHIDEIVRQTGLATHTVSSTLAILELKGLAQMVGGMQYCRTRT
ncbi:MAG: DNA-processing protein DprA, partial [Chloroflexota bacterium]